MIVWLRDQLTSGCLRSFNEPTVRGRSMEDERPDMRGRGGSQRERNGGRKEVCVYHKLTKYAPSFAHYFEAQVGGGCLLQQSRLVFPNSFTKHALWEISSDCVEIKLIGIEATCIVSSDRGQSVRKLTVLQVRKTQRDGSWAASKVSCFASKCLRKHLTAN